jgi:dTDP-4-dehydrorhamnose reductase
MIGVTGATGHLGQAICGMFPDTYQIRYNMPDIPLAGIIHAAAPNYHDDDAVIRFHDFNHELNTYLSDYRVRRIVIVGSWWQHAVGTCRDLLYTKLKDHQRRVFPGTHVIPFSIYGDEARPGRGFIPQLIEATNGTTTLAGLSNQPRDFIHVSDVARACVIALDAPRGTYIAATRRTESPRAIAARYGVMAADYVEQPTAIPRYLARPVPAWQPLVDLHAHIKAHTAP